MNVLDYRFRELLSSAMRPPMSCALYASRGDKHRRAKRKRQHEKADARRGPLAKNVIKSLNEFARASDRVGDYQESLPELQMPKRAPPASQQDRRDRPAHDDQER